MNTVFKLLGETTEEALHSFNNRIDTELMRSANHTCSLMLAIVQHWLFDALSLSLCDDSTAFATDLRLCSLISSSVKGVAEKAYSEHL